MTTRTFTLTRDHIQAAQQAYGHGTELMSHSCPIFQCLKAAGLSVKVVGPNYVRLQGGGVLTLSDSVMAITYLHPTRWGTIPVPFTFVVGGLPDAD